MKMLNDITGENLHKEIDTGASIGQEITLEEELKKHDTN